MRYFFILISALFCAAFSVSSACAADKLPHDNRALERLCAAGSNPAACAKNGENYVRGTGGAEKNPLRAAQFYMEACKSNDLESCRTTVALSRENGIATWLKDSLHVLCRNAIVSACKDGWNTFGNPNIKSVYDPEQTGKYLAFACKAADGEACFTMGVWFADIEAGDKTVEPNTAMAREGFYRACHAETSSAFSAQARIASCGLTFDLYKGNSGPNAAPDIKRAVSALSRACDLGGQEECTALATLYSQGRHGVIQDPKQAVVILERACAADEKNACESLGWTYHETLGDAVAAIPSLTKACKMGAEMWTCQAAAAAAYELRSGARHRDEAMQAACNRQYGWACYGYAYLLAKERVYSQYAEDYMKKGCRADYAPACEYLNEQADKRRVRAAQDAARREAQRKASEQWARNNPPVQSGSASSYSRSSYTPSYVTSTPPKTARDYENERRYKYNSCMGNRSNWGRC